MIHIFENHKIFCISFNLLFFGVKFGVFFKTQFSDNKYFNQRIHCHTLKCQFDCMGQEL